MVDIASNADTPDFEISDLFLGFHEDTLSSLVLSNAKIGNFDEVLEKCKDDLISLLLTTITINTLLTNFRY